MGTYLQWLKINSAMGERMTWCLNDPKKTATILNKYRATFESCNYIENSSSLQGNAIKPQGQDSPDSYRFQGRQNGPHFPHTVSQNCKMVC